jgi:hypothetical protein
MLVVSAGLLLAAWIIGWLVFEIPSRWMHVLPVLAVFPMVVYVMRTVPSKPSRRREFPK